MKKKQVIKDLNQGDFLTFIASDGKYKVIFCTSTYRKKSPQYFFLGATSLSMDTKPTIQDIVNSEFFGIAKKKEGAFKYSESELEKMWALHPEIKPCFLGTYGILIQRKELKVFRENFEFVANLSIVSNIDKNGDGSFYPGNKTFMNNFFTNNLKNIMEQRGQKQYKLKAILKDYTD